VFLVPSADAAFLPWVVRKQARRMAVPALAAVLAVAAVVAYVRATQRAAFVRSLRGYAQEVTAQGDPVKAALYWTRVNDLVPLPGAQANALYTLARLPVPVARLRIKATGERSRSVPTGR
jgi:hypothetical protein